MNNLSTNCRFLILDDHKIVLRGIYHLLKEHFQGVHIDLVSGENDFLEMLQKHDYCVIIMDLNLPDFDSIALLPNLLKRKPQLKVLAYSMHPEQIFARRLLGIGIKGYVEKGVEDTELISAIGVILKGGIFLSPKMSASLFSQTAKNETMDRFEQLSDREFEVMNLFIRGYSASKIVEIINVHPSTVSTYKARIFKKLEVESLLELVQLTRQEGLS